MGLPGNPLKAAAATSDLPAGYICGYLVIRGRYFLTLLALVWKAGIPLHGLQISMYTRMDNHAECIFIPRGVNNRREKASLAGEIILKPPVTRKKLELDAPINLSPRYLYVSS